MTAMNDLQQLVANIEDAQHKPLLRPQLTLSLVDLGHERQKVEEALNEFYKVSVQ